MNTAQPSSSHDEAWLLLPWLANGRLSAQQRDWVEAHVLSCQQCAEELSVQRRMCEAFTAPDRVIYAPGPSLRKLMDRIDAGAAEESEQIEPAQAESERVGSIATRTRSSRSGRAALWRPPGFAWAASFILMVGMTVMIATAYRWSEPRYSTRTDSTVSSRPGVLHISFDKGLTIGEVEEVLRVSGARVIEGPDSIGIFGIAPTGHGTLQDLATRMRSDPRVRWVEPTDAPSGNTQASGRGP